MDVMETKEFEGPEPFGLRIEHVLDEDPDLSFLGEYSSSWQEGAIDREELGDMERGELRYFIPGQHVPHSPKNWSHVSAAEKAKVVKQYGSLAAADEAYAMHDYERMERYNRGDWHMMGIVVTILKGAFKEVGNASLWGIESDSSAAYVEEVENDLMEEAGAEAGLPASTEWEEI